MNLLLQPANNVNRLTLALWVMAFLLLSAVAVFIAGAAMPPAYSWRVHSISESAAQGLRHAWIARLAFLSFGSAVLILSLAMRQTWARLTYWMHLMFAAAVFGTAAFSHKPGIPGVPVDPFEDLLHSATGMGFAFCIGVFTRFAQRGRDEPLRRALDALALGMATAMPIILSLSTSSGGLAQRLMFAVAYIWYGTEAFTLRAPHSGIK